MSIVLIAVRVFMIIVIFSLPLVSAGAALLGLPGACGGLGVTLLGTLFCACWLEKGISRYHQANEQIPKGLARTLEIVLLSHSGQNPRLYILNDPSPNAMVVRALFGRGTILLSQGLIALLNEEELRAVLNWCVSRLKNRGIVFQSFCSILAVWILGLAPQGWLNLVFTGRSLSKLDEKELSPISAVGFLVLYPFARLLFNLGRASVSPSQTAFWGEGYSTAVQKVAQAISLWGSGKSHGAFSLYWIPPKGLSNS